MSDIKYTFYLIALVMLCAAIGFGSGKDFWQEKQKQTAQKVYVFHDILSDPYIILKLNKPTQKDIEYCQQDSNCMDIMTIEESGLPKRKAENAN